MPMQGGMLSHRSLHARALRLRESVIARLLLTLILALSAVGTFQYFIVGNRVQAGLIYAGSAAATRAEARRPGTPPRVASPRCTLGKEP